jgi:hypothetical protein
MGSIALRLSGLLAAALLLMSRPVHAYPEFQRYVASSSGRAVNCALCHMHPDGPEGTAPGQIGRLTPAELAELGRARAALAPGAHPASPILNAFGNHLVESLGKARILELRLAPDRLAGLLPAQSDLDDDGVPDAVELAAGTHPLRRSDGPPWSLFIVNLRRNLPQLLLALAATGAGLWGLRHLLHGFTASARQPAEVSPRPKGVRP